MANRQKLIRNAERQVGRGKLNAAIDSYLKVLESSPDDTTTLNRVGDLYARLQRIEEAIQLFERAAEHFSEEGFHVKAIAIYKKILRLDPGQLAASENLARLQAHQGLVNESRQQYLSVVDGYLKRGDNESVITIYRKLVELEPRDPAHRLHLAEVLKQQDLSLEAMNQYGAIAELMLEHGKVEDALKVCREALELDYSNLEFVSRVVDDLRREGYDQEAEQFVDFAAERNPEASKILTEVEDEELEVEEPEADAPEPEAAVEDHELEVQEAKPEPDEPEPHIEEELEFEIALEDFELEPADPAEIVAAQVEEDEGLKELIIEADVLARYGLEDKAIEKLEEIVARAPEHLDSHQKLIALHVQHQNVERVVELATIFQQLSEAQNRRDAWETVTEQLLGAGFSIDGGELIPPESLPVVPSTVPESEAPGTGEAQDLSWLDEPASADEAAKAGAEGFFESEEEFFDLASELEKELEEEGGLLEEELVAAPEEQSLEEIVEGFKQGMAETLSSEDYDTHYNLGIAYREMDLIDEAISEFQLAAKDHRYLVDCCSLLAACFIEKGFPELAIKWYNEGLSSPIITEEETLGLVYELGDLYLAIGEQEEARLRFVEIYGVNSDYRDVGTKLAELEQA
jgi:tetratricopeptide (TPR) repeat protein